MSNEGKPEAITEAAQPDTDRNELLAHDELQDAELDDVTGGKGMLTLLTNLLQMKHEGLKAIVQNLRG